MKQTIRWHLISNKQVVFSITLINGWVSFSKNKFATLKTRFVSVSMVRRNVKLNIRWIVWLFELVEEDVLWGKYNIGWIWKSVTKYIFFQNKSRFPVKWTDSIAFYCYDHLKFKMTTGYCNNSFNSHYPWTNWQY